MRPIHLAALTLVLLSSVAASTHGQETYAENYNKMIALTHERRYQEAIQYGQKAEALEPNNWTAPFGISRAQSVLFLFAAADASISKAIHLFESLPPQAQRSQYQVMLYVQRAGFRKWLGELDAGIQDIEKALQVIPGNAVALGMRGEFENLGNRVSGLSAREVNGIPAAPARGAREPGLGCRPAWPDLRRRCSA